MTKQQRQLFLIVLLHILFGFLMTSRTMSKSLNILLLFVGFMTILATKNKNQEAALWSSYIIGSEVLFRMTKGLLFYEFPKYMVFTFLLTGLIIEKKKHNISPIFIIYILLLLFGITFSDIPYPESIRTNIIFNLSGPILLGLCAMYFYKRKIQLNIFIKMMYYLSLPMVSMVSYLYFKTPDIEDIRFTANSNYAASGGFGPNQVSTILGLGMFTLIILILYKKRLTGFFILDFAILLYITYRNIITLSRGGILTAILAILAFSFFYILSRKNRLDFLFKYLTIILACSLGLWFYSVSKTDGMLVNRVTNRATDGTLRKDITTGRVDLFLEEWNNFLENPFFGIGVGSGKFERHDEMFKGLPTHNEMSRLLGEHGMIGIFILTLLIVVPLIILKNASILNKSFIAAFFIFWFLTVNHSAMRLAMPAFVYGLAVMTIVNNKEIIMVKSLPE